MNLRTVVCLSFVLLLLFQAITFAAPSLLSDTSRTTIVILPTIDNSGLKNDQIVLDFLGEKLQGEFPKDKYDVLRGEKLKIALSRIGVSDLTNASDAQIIEVCRSLHADYALKPEIGNVTTKRGITLGLFESKKWCKANLPLKVNVIDIASEQTVYTNQFSEEGRHEVVPGFAHDVEAAKDAIAKILDKVDLAAAVPLINRNANE